MPDSFVVVCPILHPCSLIKASPITLGDNILVRTLKTEHLGAILKKSPSQADLIKGSLKSIIIDCANQKPDHQAVVHDLLACTFALNVFADSGSIIHHRPYVIRFNRVHQAIETLDHQTIAASEGHSFKIRADIKPSEITAVFQGVRNAIQKEPKFSISLRRFNASQAKNSHEEKIIDLAICLESMFASQTEIAFQFSLYNAMLSEEDATKRHDTFRLLKQFYSWRSKIVHGNSTLDAKWFDENWVKIVRLAKLSILTKANFIAKNNLTDWKEHLEKLVLGMEDKA